MPKRPGLPGKEELRLNKRIAKKYDCFRRRHPEIRGKRVDRVTYNIEDDELYVTVLLRSAPGRV
jgi:hypothetical protein